MILSRRYECVLTQLTIDLPGVDLEHCNNVIDALQDRLGWYIPVMVSGYHEPGKRLSIEVDGNHGDPDQVLAWIREIHEELLKENNAPTLPTIELDALICPRYKDSTAE